MPSKWNKLVLIVKVFTARLRKGMIIELLQYKSGII